MIYFDEILPIRVAKDENTDSRNNFYVDEFEEILREVFTQSKWSMERTQGPIRQNGDDKISGPTSSSENSEEFFVSVEYLISRVAA